MKQIYEAMAKAGYETQSGNKWKNLPRGGIIFSLWMKIARKMAEVYCEEVYFKEGRRLL